MTRWNWNERRRYRSGSLPGWLRALSAAVPYLTVAVAFATVMAVGGVPMASEGTLFALPETEVEDVAETSAVALVTASRGGTLVFFDDTRYVLGDERQADELAGQMRLRFESADPAVLLLLADRRTSIEEVLRLSDIARRSGASRVLVAGTRSGAGGER